MSITAKDGKSIVKKEFGNTAETQQGFKNLVFYHEAALGETSIDLTALNAPSGQVNPSSSDLADAKLFRFKNNLVLVSTLRGMLINNIAYTVNSGTSIKLKFEAEQNEIFFGILQSVPVQLQGIEAKTPVVEGDLADGQTDFAIGFATKTKYDEILVFRNGLEQKRNSNNSDTLLDGNYYVVDNGSGFGSVVRFNDAASGQDDYIKVTAIGGIVSSPTDSVFDEIQKLQGQIDAMVVDLALATGNPETDYQGTPNNVDIRQFGARVIGLEEPGQPGVPLQSTTTIAGAQKKNKIQTKLLPSNVTTNGTMAALTFNNLVPGNFYEVRGIIDLAVNFGANDALVAVDAINNSAIIHRVEILLTDGTSSGDQIKNGVNFVFQAQTSTLTFVGSSITANSLVVGNNTRSSTYIQLEERNDLVETADFT